MKRLIYLVSAIALFCGCQKFAETQDLEIKNPSNNPIDNLPEVIYAHMADNKDEESSTRTIIDNNKNIHWQKGDEISYFSGKSHNVKYLYNDEAGATENQFTKVQGTGFPKETSVNISHGIYPYDSRTAFVNAGNNDANTFTVYYPEVQNYAPNSFGQGANVMIATNKDPEANKLYFRNMCGYFVLKLYGESMTVKSITLIGNNNEKLAGQAKIQIWPDENNKPNIGMQAEDPVTSVTLNCGENGVQLGTDADHATEFWFALPPVEFTKGLKVEITDSYGNTITKSTSNKVVITRNTIQPMKAFSVEQLFEGHRMYYTRTGDSKEPVTIGNETFKANTANHYYDTEERKFVIVFKSLPTNINESAFAGTDITSITIPESVLAIGKMAFKGTKLTQVTIPEKVWVIGQEAFYNTPLTEITIPGNVNYIHKGAFYGCTNLTKVTFEPSASSKELYIGIDEENSYPSPFKDSPITTVSIDRKIVDDNNLNIPNVGGTIRASGLFFESPKNITSVTLGNQVEALRDGIFNGSKITSIELPTSLRVIGASAFEETLITSLTIPKNVKTIGTKAFWNCQCLATLEIEAGDNANDALEIRCAKDGKMTGNDNDMYGPFYCSPLSNITLNREIAYNQPDGSAFLPINIYNGLFYIHPSNRAGSTTLSLGGTLKTIPKFTFSELKISSITIPASVTKIGSSAFFGCSNLTTVNFLEGNETLAIGCKRVSVSKYGTFYDSSLSSITLNRELSYIDDNENTVIPDEADEGIFYNNNRASSVSVSIGSKVKNIHPYMFSHLNITEINIPSTVMSVGDYAFWNCDALTNATLGAVETKLGVFYDCDALGEVTIAGSVNSMGNDAFYSCNNIKKVTLLPSPNNTQLTLGYQTYGTNQQGTFYDCPLTTVVWNREINYTLHNAGELDQDDEGIFSYSPNLSSVTIGQNVTSILPYTFSNTGITSISIPTSVTTIGKNAFENCTKLASFTFPASLMSVGNNAFDNCTSLSSVTFDSSSTPLTIGFQDHSSDKGTFYDSPLSSITLNREIVYDYDDLDAADEGVFSKYNNPSKSPEATVTLGPNVKKILPWMFCGVRMSTITIPASVTSIGQAAFSECSMLESVYLKHTGGMAIPTLGEGAFHSCPYELNFYVYNVTRFRNYSRWANYGEGKFIEWNPTAN